MATLRNLEVGAVALPPPTTKAEGIAKAEEVLSSELRDELWRASVDFENGDYVELTAAELETCIETGESPWLVEFHD
jgi:hypothetical protein